MVNIQYNDTSANSQIVHRFDINATYSFNSNYSLDEKLGLEIKRSLIDNHFSLKISYTPVVSKNLIFETQINNNLVSRYESGNVIANKTGNLFLLKEHLKENITKVNKIIVVVKEKNELNQEEIIFKGDYFITRYDYQRNYILKDKKLSFKIPWIIRVSTTGYNVKNRIDHKHESDYFNVEIEKQPINRLVHFTKLYKLKIYNDKSENVLNDFHLSMSPLENTLISNEKDEKFRPIFNRILNNKNLVEGFIELTNNSYYDFDKKATFVGSSKNAKEGLLIPFNFKGSFDPKVTLKFNEALENLTLSYHQYFPDRLLDKYEGKIKLNFEEISSNISKQMKFFTIKNGDFSKIINENLSLQALENLYFKEEKEILNDSEN
ncbi:unknown; predicted coding region [Mycoplasmopsis pulmonis]|uniref:Uncharacterized protein n=1 Tax=Mycoplasmopsis pulmonis (strain UAB CTIP) TaxID=272635 RepID=Q98QK5_MYCPU|nr:hypothetical protein [Mycoplasmopsis pulmonis]MDZ7293313.1 hypothetical protein [Mycoplasmopsis pulmonis]CAC13529.1 unknown; predicted coding region [Mycoplasmopsis pulmonis]VEU68118.1 Uncharacterised protein [Mycoplasmopsis pulmonis]